jgi:hypothetical protein
MDDWLMDQDKPHESKPRSAGDALEWSAPGCASGEPASRRTLSVSLTG